MRAVIRRQRVPLTLMTIGSAENERNLWLLVFNAGEPLEKKEFKYIFKENERKKPFGYLQVFVVRAPSL